MTNARDFLLLYFREVNTLRLLAIGALINALKYALVQIILFSYLSQKDLASMVWAQCKAALGVNIFLDTQMS